jgi:hypothetical protein
MQNIGMNSTRKTFDNYGNSTPADGQSEHFQIQISKMNDMLEKIANKIEKK